MTDDRFASLLGRLDGGPRPLPDGVDERLWARLEETMSTSVDTATADDGPDTTVVELPKSDGRPAPRPRRWHRVVAAGVAAAAVIAIAALLTRDGGSDTEIGPVDSTPGVTVPDSSFKEPAARAEPAVDMIAYLSPSSPPDDGDFKLVIVRADGSGTAELNEPGVWNPSWSADGTFLVFACGADPAAARGVEVICSVDADGSGFSRLTEIPDTDSAGGWTADRGELDLQPAISPDGARIAFVTWRNGPGTPDRNPEIFVMDADGADMTNLTAHPAGDARPMWSPDGTRIAFVSSRAGDDFDLFVMNADGSDVTRLGHSGADVSWSPDGTRLVTAGPRGLLEGPLVVVTVDTGETTMLAEHGSQPAWSPDGALIAFTVTEEDGRSRIAVVEADGGDPVVLTDDGSWPSWSPGGDRIAYAATDGLWVMNADGSDRDLIVDEPGATEPSWSPAVAVGS